MRSLGRGNHCVQKHVRDDTEHSKIYYTHEQLREYGKRCAEDAMAKIDASRTKNNASGQPKDIEDLMRGFGKKP